jgi:hypothetical protein
MIVINNRTIKVIENQDQIDAIKATEAMLGLSYDWKLGEEYIDMGIMAGLPTTDNGTVI